MSFSELAHENKFKAHKRIRAMQVMESDLQSCMAFKHQMTLVVI